MKKPKDTNLVVCIIYYVHYSEQDLLGNIVHSKYF